MLSNRIGTGAPWWSPVPAFEGQASGEIPGPKPSGVRREWNSGVTPHTGQITLIPNLNLEWGGQ